MKIRLPFPTSRNDQLRGGSGWDRIETSLQAMGQLINDGNDQITAAVEAAEAAQNAAETAASTAMTGTPEGYSDVLASIGEEFSAEKAYTAGTYVWRNSKLYLFISDHAAGSWTGTDAEEAVISDKLTDLNIAIENRLLDGNLFNTKTLTYNTDLATDGTESAGSVYVISDYIAVKPGETLYESSSTVRRRGRYNKNKQWLGTASVSSGVMSVPSDTYYIRICIASSVIPDYVLSRNSALTNKYGFYPKIGISDIDITKNASDFIHKNNTDAEELLQVESYTASSCVVVKQTDYTYGAKEGYILSGASAIDGRFTCSSFNTYGITEIDFYAYIPEPTKVSSLTFKVADGSYSFTSFVAGLNIFKAYTYSATLPTTATSTTLRITGSFTSKTQVFFAKAVLKRADKANIIIVQDGGYSTFLELAYPTLKALGAPVTWALNPGRLGESVGDAGTIFTQEQIDALADDGNSEFSFHCWDATTLATASMTPTEIQDDVAKCLHYLRDNGICPAHVWRAAHAQNTAPNYSAEIGMVEALATYNSVASIDVFPFKNRWNVPRIAIHGRTTSEINTLFNTLQKTHSTAVVYTHGIDDSQYNMAPDLFEHFAGKLSDGITGGWLRPTTYSRLMDTPSAWLND